MTLLRHWCCKLGWHSWVYHCGVKYCMDCPAQKEGWQ